MNAHADMLIVVSTQRIKHTKGHLSLSCFRLVKFSGFRNSKTSANERLLLCLLPSAVDVQTSPTLVHGAKVQKKMYMCKKKFFYCHMPHFFAGISGECVAGGVRIYKKNRNFANF